MTRTDRRWKDEARDFVLLYLALLKRGDLVAIYDEARKRISHEANDASGRKAG